MREETLIPLPVVAQRGDLSVEMAMHRRRSVREFSAGSVTLQELGQILWAAQGVTEPMREPPAGFAWEWRGGLRTVPSAGALYPLEIFVIAGEVDGADPGVYRYVPQDHGLLPLSDGDRRESLWDAALRQTAILTAPVTIVIAGVVERTALKYGDRAERYVHMEVGAAAQNVYLQAESLGLGTVLMGAFEDERVRSTLELPADHRVYGIMPVGRKMPP